MLRAAHLAISALLLAFPAFAQIDASSLVLPLPPGPLPEMAPIPAGSFLMGSDAPNAHPYFNGSGQQPVHLVTISEPFWMSRHEVTQAQYQALMGTNPSSFVGPTRPVERVSWYDAVAYCAALNAHQSAAGLVPPGYMYRLPTEAEWEYACRAGTTTEFHYGPSLFCDQAKFGYSTHSDSSCSSSGTSPVGSYAPNPWGLYDMHGNVWEWCLDSWSTYTWTPKTDPFVTGGPSRIIRGGGWVSDSFHLRSATRTNYLTGGSMSSIGFRVVLAPECPPRCQ